MGNSAEFLIPDRESGKTGFFLYLRKALLLWTMAIQTGMSYTVRVEEGGESMNWLMFFLVICMYPLLLVVYSVMKKEVVPKGNLRFGVTVPKAYLEDAQVLEIVKKFKFWMKLSMLILFIVPLPFLFVPYVSVAFMMWTFWIFAILFCLWYLFAKANRQVAQLKEKEHWQFSVVEAKEEEQDKFWKWGMVYNNPNDKQGIVNTRMGMGTTVNMAKRWARMLTIAGVVCMLSMPVIGIWVLAEEFTPVYLKYEDGCVVAGQLRENYRINSAQIQEVRLLSEVPGMSKKNGTGLNNLRKGTYHIRNVGDCEVLQNPQNEYVLYIRTADGEYYLGAAEDTQTQKVYNEIKDGM